MKASHVFAVICTFILITGCGGGGGAADAPFIPTDPPIAGITRTGIMAGPISGFGSIIVNGVHYATTGASFEINGSAGTQSDLKVGQFVVVKGKIEDDLQNGTATSVVFNDNVKGPVQLIDTVQNRLIVLGQTVLIDSLTSFDDSVPSGSITGLQLGDILEVSGIVDANGAITATRIELKPAGAAFEVLGIITNLDTTAKRFSVNNLSVDYSGASIEDFPGSVIENGQLAEIDGTQLGAGGELLATKVEFKGNDISGDAGDRIELQGFITRFLSATDFDVAGIPVTTTIATLFENGVAGDLGLNVKVEVEGDFDANGSIVAVKVEIRRARAVRIEAPIDSINAAANSLIILNVPVTLDAQTRLEDKSDLDRDPLTINDLNAGDYLEVRGSEFPAGSGTVLAAIVERDDLDTDVELQGFVTAFSDPTITVLGVTIETAGAVFRDANDTPLSRTEFFDQLAVNALVKAKGSESSSSVITAEEVEFEIEN